VGTNHRRLDMLEKRARDAITEADARDARRIVAIWNSHMERPSTKGRELWFHLRIGAAITTSPLSRDGDHGSARTHISAPIRAQPSGVRSDRISPIGRQLAEPSSFTNGGFGRHRRQENAGISDSIAAARCWSSVSQSISPICRQAGHVKASHR
jgi:hypothetical protein